MQPGDSLSLKVKPQIPLPTSTLMLCDTLHIIKGADIYKVMLCINPVLLTKTKPSAHLADVKVYPNPTNSSVTFSFYNETSSTVNIEVFSANGELVAIPARQKINNGHISFYWDGKNLNNQELPAGLYFYRITCSNYFGTGKISIFR